jgi:hypothetical protein
MKLEDWILLIVDISGGELSMSDLARKVQKKLGDKVRRNEIKATALALCVSNRLLVVPEIKFLSVSRRRIIKT